VWNFHHQEAQWQDGVVHALTDLLALLLINVILFLFAYLAFMRYQIT
jgi:hypothetical protein